MAIKAHNDLSNVHFVVVELDLASSVITMIKLNAPSLSSRVSETTFNINWGLILSPPTIGDAAC
jgi:hypothetical protein